MEIPFQAAIIEALHQSDAWSLVLEWLENAYNQHEMGYRIMSLDILKLLVLVMVPISNDRHI